MVEKVKKNKLTISKITLIILHVQNILMKILFVLLIIFTNLSNVFSQPEKKFAAAFVQSVAKNNFQLLKPYLLTSGIAQKYFGKEFTKMPTSKQIERIKKINTDLQKKWTKVVANAKANKIDFSRLLIKQFLYMPPEEISEERSFDFLLITYEYENMEWDDLIFIVNKNGTSKYILELPLNTNMFALNKERRGKNINDIQLAMDKNDPKIKEYLKDAIENLKKFAEQEDATQLYNYMAYTGEKDKDNRWKRIADASKPEDVESTKMLRTKLKSELANCPAITYENVRIEKESEGVWYVITAICGTKKTEYAFLKINNAFVLGDID